MLAQKASRVVLPSSYAIVYGLSGKDVYLESNNNDWCLIDIQV